MRSHVVEVDDISLRRAEQMPFMQDQQVIQTLAVHTFQKSLAYCVRPGCTDGVRMTFVPEALTA